MKKKPYEPRGDMLNVNILNSPKYEYHCTDREGKSIK